MSRTARRVLSVLLVASCAAVLAACGGSSSKSSEPAGTTTTSGAAKPTEGSIAPGSDATAAKAALQLADVGAGFAAYRKATGILPAGAKSCSVTEPGAVLKTGDHVYSGPMFKKKNSNYFAYSQAYVFRTEDLAKKFAAFRATPAYKQCQVRFDDATTREARAGAYVKLAPTSFPDQSGHIPTMYREYTGSVSGGKQVDGGFYDRYTVRRGRVVVVVDVDSELGKDDAASQALAQQTGEILRALDTALTGRLAGV